MCSKFRSYLSIYFFVKILNMNKNMNPVRIFLCKNIHQQILLAWPHKTVSTNKKNQRTVPKQVTAWCCAINGRWITKSKTFLKVRLRMYSCWASMLTTRQLKHWFYFDIISIRLETPIILFTGIKLQLDQYFRVQILPLCCFSCLIWWLDRIWFQVSICVRSGAVPGWRFYSRNALDTIILQRNYYQWPGTFCSPGHITATCH